MKINRGTICKTGAEKVNKELRYVKMVCIYGSNLSDVDLVASCLTSAVWNCMGFLRDRHIYVQKIAIYASSAAKLTCDGSWKKVAGEQTQCMPKPGGSQSSALTNHNCPWYIGFIATVHFLSGCQIDGHGRDIWPPVWECLPPVWECIISRWQQRTIYRILQVLHSCFYHTTVGSSLTTLTLTIHI